MPNKMQGTRLYNATSGTAWVALAAGAAPSGSFTQITLVDNIRVVPHETNSFDNAPLEATVPAPEVELRPGTMDFTIEGGTSQSNTLRTLCDAGTKKVWAVLYLDGTADTVTGRLICTDGASPQRGDFNRRVLETYRVIGDTVVTRQAAA